MSPLHIRNRQLDPEVYSSEHVSDTTPSFKIRCVVDLFLYDGATDPSPFARIAVLQYQEHRLGFQPYAIPALIVKRAVQAADVEIDLKHGNHREPAGPRNRLDRTPMPVRPYSFGSSWLIIQLIPNRSRQ